ncbi:MAG TPA: hypothetical protein DEA40_11815, partial [Parvularcula sp.]|nr:hypothetical protein [Parvularcula sp.]
PFAKALAGRRRARDDYHSGERCSDERFDHDVLLHFEAGLSLIRRADKIASLCDWFCDEIERGRVILSAAIE